MSAVQEGARSVSEPAISPPPQPQSSGMTGPQRIVVIVIGLLAVIGFGLGLFATINAPSTAPLQRQINALKAVDASQHQQIAALQTATGTLKAATAAAATAGNLTVLQTSVGGLSKTMVGVQGDLSQLHTCLPELTQEINGLNINTANTGGYLTSAYLTNPTIISTNCTKFLAGP